MTNIYFESILMAWGSIVSNKMRSLLTMLGIIIGVAAVIALMSIGYGVQDKITSDISSLGSNTITVTPGTGRKPGVRAAAGSMQTLTYKDYLAIKNLPNITYAAPLVNNSYLLVSGNKNWTTRIYGCTEDYARISSLFVQEGRFWTTKEYSSRARVCVIGKTVAAGLFGEESPLGQKVRINGDPFTVIGLLEEKGYSFMDQDDRVLIPFTTVQERMLHITYVNNIVITSDNADDLSQIESDVTSLLRTRHRIQTGKEDDFSISNSQDLMAAMKSTTQTLTIFLGSIAAISLLVGGIGIMNIMLVSVTERTREIGIRKALGATYTMIIVQFLIESVTVSVAGGLIGVLLGIGASKVIPMLTTLSTVLAVTPILGSFMFSVLIGLVFGLYPAQKAAKLNPIDALHYE
ncbi:ABC transporter permease [Dialister sp.]|uniref:ABC transporter permease n=1 Tax=Dialister sp. TaxID=1955814 RepID=UPI002E81C6F5|nr:ABC transporter permease [Dialister sp.]MEE3451967.1 ABC transporter permease [Dialister sp.]